ncbi:MAG: helix-turn-helix transcriptional regulator [Saprospiraceae bacterium]|nr:helix-turn-helix transcriptional regulator [Saprospiraceae bacterium]
MINLFDFANGNPLFKQMKVSDTLFTEYKCLEEQSIFKIWSNVNYFVYVLSGKKKWKSQQAEYMIYPGEAVFVKKGASIIHKFFETQFCALIIFVPDHFIQNLIQQNADSIAKTSPKESDSVIPLHLDESLNIYFQSLYTYFLKEQNPSANLLEIKFKELILNLASTEKNAGLCHYFKLLCYESKSSLQDIMEANFTFNLTLEDFARLSHRSLTTFKRDFKTLYQMPPGKWLIKKRLEFARNMLETSDKSINDIAFESGFENTSHFIKKFKDTFGTTPLQHQKSSLLSTM